MKADLWRLEPHACRACMGRVASREAGADAGAPRVWACTLCGLELTGSSPRVVCCCGLKVKAHSGRGGGSMVDAGVRCLPNAHPTPEFPALYVAGHVGPD